MVASYTQLLADRYRGKLDEPADSYINYAVDGAKRMQSLIQDLLAFSRAGRLEAELKATDCNTVLAGAIQKMQGEITESGAIINHPDLPRLTGNEPQLRQVFQQLIGNAIKFRGAAAPVLDISVRQQGHDWMFAVADNGYRNSRGTGRERVWNFQPPAYSGRISGKRHRTGDQQENRGASWRDNPGFAPPGWWVGLQIHSAGGNALPVRGIRMTLFATDILPVESSPDGMDLAGCTAWHVRKMNE